MISTGFALFPMLQLHFSVGPITNDGPTFLVLQGSAGFEHYPKSSFSRAVLSNFKLSKSEKAQVAESFKTPDRLKS
jgi:hypothetical protein